MNIEMLEISSTKNAKDNLQEVEYREDVYVRTFIFGSHEVPLYHVDLQY